MDTTGIQNQGDMFLAVDLGAGSGRVVLGSFGDDKLEVKEIHRFVNRPVSLRGTLHWDALDLHHHIMQGIRKAADLSRGMLQGIGVDAWGVDFGLLDERGRLIGNPVHYRDARTEGMMEKVFEAVPRDQIFEATGIQFLSLNTLYQLAAMNLEGGECLARAHTLLMMPDLFHYFLCGCKKSEFTIATTTQCFDPRKGDWARELLAALSIPTHFLPEVVLPGTVLGVMDGEAAREAGAADVPVIAPAAHDTGSAVAAIPVEAGAEPGSWSYISSGTWSLLGIELSRPIINAAALRHNFTNEGGVNGTFRFLKNIAGLWMIQECQRLWSIDDGRELSFEELNRLAVDARPFDHLIDPDHRRFLRPGHMPNAIREFCRCTGQTEPVSRGEIVRSVLESLALKYRLVLRALEEVSGRKIKVVHVVGGGSKNDLLNYYTADALGATVIAGPDEATAIGNLAAQAMATGLLSDLAAARALIRRSIQLKVFEPGDPDPWDEAEPKFLRVLEQGADLK